MSSRETPYVGGVYDAEVYRNAHVYAPVRTRLIDLRRKNLQFVKPSAILNAGNGGIAYSVANLVRFVVGKVVILGRALQFIQDVALDNIKGVEQRSYQ